MDSALYVVMSGAKENLLSQSVRANNLANVSTTGFRSDFAQARSMPVFGETFPSRVYAQTENPGTNFNKGTLDRTGRSLDIAVIDEGFIAVQTPDGAEAYTLAGNLRIDEVGRLLAGNGLPVLGNGGTIEIPPEQVIEIGFDGTISVQEASQGPEGITEVDRIKLVNPPLDAIVKGEDGLFRRIDGEAEPAAAEVQVVSGSLETSNVNPIAEFTEIVSLSRQFEMQIKLMNKVEENDESVARVLQISS